MPCARGDSLVDTTAERGRARPRRQGSSRTSPRIDCAPPFALRSLARLARHFREAPTGVAAETARLTRHRVGVPVGAETTFLGWVAQRAVGLRPAALPSATDVLYAGVVEWPTLGPVVSSDVPALGAIAEVGRAGIAVVARDPGAACETAAEHVFRDQAYLIPHSRNTDHHVPVAEALRTSLRQRRRL